MEGLCSAWLLGAQRPDGGPRVCLALSLKRVCLPLSCALASAAPLVAPLLPCRLQGCAGPRPGRSLHSTPALVGYSPHTQHSKPARVVIVSILPLSPPVPPPYTYTYMHTYTLPLQPQIFISSELLFLRRTLLCPLPVCYIIVACRETLLRGVVGPMGPLEWGWGGRRLLQTGG